MPSHGVLLVGSFDFQLVALSVIIAIGCPIA